MQCDINDVLAGCDQLLSKELPEPGGGLDRPYPIDIKRFSPRQQAGV